MKELGSDLTGNVADIARCQALKPTESLYIGKKGYKRTYRADGSYEWKYSFKPNEGGKLTKEALEVGEHMAPFTKADTERQQKLQSQAERVPMRDANGATQYVEPHKAEATAKANGWGHRWSAGGVPVERGKSNQRQSMLWRRVSNGWEPTGRYCLGTPLWGTGVVSKRGLQFDPDGQPWRFTNKAWRPVCER